MKILKKLFGNLNLDINSLVDDVVTTDEERKSLKIKLKQVILDAESSAQEQITRRWESDNKAGWLPANIRPLTLAFLIISTVLLVFIDSGTINFNVEERWVSLLEITLLTTVGAYFGSRGFEKIKKK
jgi:hypothetical protein|tara:strand:- start:1032 stop:1412 length:381 start_codon:yes stop_codon:yes gene_type:complete